MYNISPTLELEGLEEFQDLGEFEDMEELDEDADWEIEALRRRRRPIRAVRRPTRQPPRQRRPVRAVRRPIRRPPRRHRPIHVIRRYVPMPYPMYRPTYEPPATIRTRPAAILSRFHFDRAFLRRQHIHQIKRTARRVVASWRTERPVRTIRLVGHTDNRGSARQNRQLGRQRALAARSRLIREINRLRPGLTRRMRIVARTAGETRPIASNRTASGRALNHRVEIFLLRAP